MASPVTPPDTLTPLMIGDCKLSQLDYRQLRILVAVSLEALGTIGAGRGTIDGHTAAIEALEDIRSMVKRFAV